MRTLTSCEVTAEAMSFPFAAQAAIVQRETTGRKREAVALLTSVPFAELDAAAWLGDNRGHWGIENGLHLRLDVSRYEDKSRIRTGPAAKLHGLFTRIANSLFAHWRSCQPKPQHKTTTDFTTFMAADHDRRAIFTLTAVSPSFAKAS